MKQLRWLLLILPFLVLLISAKKDVNKSAPHWLNLFNGKNLNGWTPKIAGYKSGENFGNTFRVEQGILSTRYNAYDTFNNRFGALFYNKPFKDFRLKVEYRFTGDTVRGAPSWGYKDGGIQYFCEPPQSMKIDQSFPICLEYNLLGTRPSGEICANGMYVQINGKRNPDYCNVPTVKKQVPADDWVTAEIEVHNGTIKHFINGEEVLSFEDPHYDSTNAIAKNFINGTDTKVSSGFISLQSNSHPMDFKSVAIIEY